MKLKKVLAVLCVCALAVSLAVPVFAASDTPADASIDYEGGFPDSDLEVAVSVLFAMKKLYVNPYGLPYNIKNTTLNDEDSSEIYEETVSDGWFSNTAVIKNLAPKALPVSVTIKTTEKGDARVVASANDASNYPAYNCLYGNFQITKAINEDGVITPTDWVLNTGATDETNHMKQVAIPATGAPVTLQDTQFEVDEAKEGEGANEGLMMPGFAAFRIRGSAVIRTADGTSGNIGEWDDGSNGGDGDVVDMTVAFTFG